MAGQAPQLELESLLVRVIGNAQSYYDMIDDIQKKTLDLTRWLRENLRIGDIWSGGANQARMLAEEFTMIEMSAASAAAAVDIFTGSVKRLALAQEAAMTAGATWASSMAAGASAAGAAASSAAARTAAVVQSVPIVAATNQAAPTAATAWGADLARTIEMDTTRQAAAAQARLMATMEVRGQVPIMGATDAQRAWVNMARPMIPLPVVVPTTQALSQTLASYGQSMSAGHMAWLSASMPPFPFPYGAPFGPSAAQRAWVQQAAATPGPYGTAQPGAFPFPYGMSYPQSLPPYGTAQPGNPASPATARNWGEFANAVNVAGGSVNNFVRSLDASFRSMTNAETGLRILSFAMLAFGAYSVKVFAEFDDSLTRSLARMGDFSQANRRFLEDATFGLSSRSITPVNELNRSLGSLTASGMNAAAAVRAMSIAETFAVISHQDMTTATRQLVLAQQNLGMNSTNVETHMTNMTRLSSLFYRMSQILNIEVGEVAAAMSIRFGQALQFNHIALEEGIGVLTTFILAGERGAVAGDNAALAILSINRAMAANLPIWQQHGINVSKNRRGVVPSITDIVEQLHGILANETDPLSSAGTLSRLGFDRLRANVLLPLIQNAPAIRIMEEEARKLNLTLAETVAIMIRGDFASQFMILRNNFQNLAITIGQALAPLLAVMNDYLKDSIQWFMSLNPAICQAIILFTLLGVGAAPGLRFIVMIISGALLPALSLLIFGITTIITLGGWLVTILVGIGGAILAIGWPILLAPLALLINFLPILIGLFVLVGSIAKSFSIADFGAGLLTFFEGIAAFFKNFTDNISALMTWIGENWKTILKDAATAFGVFLINMIYNWMIATMAVVGVLQFAFLTWLPAQFSNLVTDFIALFVFLAQVIWTIMSHVFVMIAQIFDVAILNYIRENWRSLLLDLGRFAEWALTNSIRAVAWVILSILYALFIGIKNLVVATFNSLPSLILPALTTIGTMIRDAWQGRPVVIAGGVAGGMGAGPSASIDLTWSGILADMGRFLTRGPTWTPPNWESPAIGEYWQRRRVRSALGGIPAQHIADMTNELGTIFQAMPSATADYMGLLGGVFNIMRTAFNQMRSPLEGFEPETRMTRRLRVQMFRLGPEGLAGLLPSMNRLFGEPGMGDPGMEPLVSGHHGPGYRFQTQSLQRYVLGGVPSALTETQVFQAALLHKQDQILAAIRGNRPQPVVGTRRPG